jgi:hypothetical protein
MYPRYDCKREKDGILIEKAAPKLSPNIPCRYEHSHKGEPTCHRYEEKAPQRELPSLRKHTGREILDDSGEDEARQGDITGKG